VSDPHGLCRPLRGSQKPATINPFRSYSHEVQFPIFSVGAIAVVGALAVATIALHRGEQINALWLSRPQSAPMRSDTASIASSLRRKCCCSMGSGATPAERLRMAATFFRQTSGLSLDIISGHCWTWPLIGPTLAAQFGYLPGTLWILVGACLGLRSGFRDLAVFRATDGKSLTEMAKERSGAWADSSLTPR